MTVLFHVWRRIRIFSKLIRMPELGFWGKLQKPFFVLAPMADVTDAAFRRVIAKYGKPDVMYTEFVSTDGLLSPGRAKLMRDLVYTEAERPIVAQIFGTKPDHFEKIATQVAEMGFDGIDINMGCPERSLVKSGSCAGLIDTPDLAVEIVRATKRGAGKVPVSVKTRLGNRKVVIDTWLPKLLEAEPAVVTLHARTAKEMSLVPARWEEIARAVEVARGSGTLIVGNGDVKDLADARAKAAATGADGVMLGRAIFGNPFLFNESFDVTALTLKQKLAILLDHAKLFEELLGDVKNFAIMRKHFGAYVKGFPGAAELRMQLMEAENTEAMARIMETVA